jgi:ribose 5-phosphate isomerase RpiB
MNRKLALEMSRMVTQLKELIHAHMLMKEHKIIAYGKYKDNGRLITKICDFVELFASVNGRIVNEEQIAVTNIFRDVT